MRKFAIYGKGGIGKSTTSSNLALALASKGLRVMQIGCDPKADSTMLLRAGRPLPTVLDLFRERGEALELDDVVMEGCGGVLCVEAGGPVPGHGCAGRGIAAALEMLGRKGAYESFGIDVVLYDVLGDVVCGGFSMPMRKGYADSVLILTSGENMSVYAAANVAMAVKGFAGRGYAGLGGFILNRRGVEEERERVERLVSDFESSLLADIAFSKDVQAAEKLGKCVLDAFPESEAAQSYRNLADALLTLGDGECCR